MRLTKATFKHLSQFEMETQVNKKKKNENGKCVGKYKIVTNFLV